VTITFQDGQVLVRFAEKPAEAPSPGPPQVSLPYSRIFGRNVRIGCPYSLC
jgi:hypothetical protein